MRKYGAKEKKVEEKIYRQGKKVDENYGAEKKKVAKKIWTMEPRRKSRGEKNQNIELRRIKKEIKR